MTLNDLSFVTVLDVKVFANHEDMASYYEDPELNASDLAFTLDSLRISNITQEGPIKEARGGQENMPIIRHGKTVRLEMEDVIMHDGALELFMGAKVDTANNVIEITEKFQNTPLVLVGETYTINKTTGEREYVKITFHKFIPDSIFDLTLESEGDVAVLNMAGELFSKCGVFFSIGEGIDPCAE